MQCQIVAVGNKMPLWCVTAYDDYSKRLQHYLKHTLIEVPVSHTIDEGNKMIQKIPSSHLVIALDERGAMWNTANLATKLASWQVQSQSISILIGGPDGLSEPCLKRATLRWSLSELTFPHPLVRVILIEQLYRAMSILANHPYHRA